MLYQFVQKKIRLVDHPLFVHIVQIHLIPQIHLQRLLLPIHHQSMFQLK